MIDPVDWRPTDSLTLEQNALRAITTIGKNVLVSAGPGSGKTELLAQRSDFLFRTGKCCYPRRILAISFKKDAAQNLRNRILVRSGGSYAARFDSFTFHAFAKRLIDSYRPALVGPSSLAPNYRIDKPSIPGIQITFDDLIFFALEIIEKNHYARNALRQTYSHVFLDEFQDTTPAQYDIIKAAFEGTDTILTAVGDINQRIMAWAGALEGVMQTFADDFNADSLMLYQNFRSAPMLRKMQNRMIENMNPTAASPETEIVGGSGIIGILHSTNQIDEARKTAKLIGRWIDDGIPPNEIGILVRQQPKHMTEALTKELRKRDISYRNEQNSQDLAADPVAGLIFNFLWVVAGDRRPEAYSELMRLTSPLDVDDDAGRRFDSRLKRFIRDSRTKVRSGSFDQCNSSMWEHIIRQFLNLVSRPALNALSPSYQQGEQLNQVIDNAIQAFGDKLREGATPVDALKHLSDLDSVKIMTIHKCKGLEFKKVIVLGVEEECFWGKYSIFEFFVAISRAKEELVLTYVDHRDQPSSPVNHWNVRRTAHQKFLAYAQEYCHRL